MTNSQQPAGGLQRHHGSHRGRDPRHYAPDQQCPVQELLPGRVLVPEKGHVKQRRVHKRQRYRADPPHDAGKTVETTPSHLRCEGKALRSEGQGVTARWGRNTLRMCRFVCGGFNSSQSSEEQKKKACFFHAFVDSVYAHANDARQKSEGLAQLRELKRHRDRR